MSPTARSLQELRKRGYKAFVVEKYNYFAKIRIDFGGFADIVAFRAAPASILAVQATSASNMSSRFKKVSENENARAWLVSGGRLAVWGWAKQGPRGKRKTYALKEIDII